MFILKNSLAAVLYVTFRWLQIWDIWWIYSYLSATAAAVDKTIRHIDL